MIETNALAVMVKDGFKIIQGIATLIQVCAPMIARFRNLAIDVMEPGGLIYFSKTKNPAKRNMKIQIYHFK